MFDAEPSTTTSIVIGSGAGGGTVAQALVGDVGARADPRARRLRSAGAGEQRSRRRSGSTSATGRPNGGSTATGRSFQPVHALLRRRQHEVLGQRALPPAPRGLPGEMPHVDGVSPAWPIDYDTLAPYYERAERLYHVHGEHRPRPDRAAARAVPVRADPARAADGGGHRATARAGAASLAAAAGPGPARASRTGCILCNTCNSFPCRLPGQGEADVLCVRPAHAPRQRDALDERHRAAARHGRRRARRSPRSRSNGTASAVRVDASLVVVSCGAVNSAALLLQSARPAHPNGLANSSGLVGRRYMAHLATMMQGFHPFRVNDTVFQKTVAINDFYLRGPDTPFPLGQIQSQGRTHGVMAQIVVPWIPLWAYDAWVARGHRLAGDVRGPAARGQPRQSCTPDGRDPAATTARTTSSRTGGSCARCTASCGGSASGRSSSTRTTRRTPRTSAARCASAPIRAGRCSIRSAARTTSRTCSSSTRRSSPRRRPSTRR